MPPGYWITLNKPGKIMHLDVLRVCTAYGGPAPGAANDIALQLMHGDM
jgi:hypothetical protein